MHAPDNISTLPVEPVERFGRVAIKTHTVYTTPDNKQHHTLHAAWEHVREGLLADMFGRAGCRDFQLLARSVIGLNRDDRDELVRLLTTQGEDL